MEEIEAEEEAEVAEVTAEEEEEAEVTVEEEEAPEVVAAVAPEEDQENENSESPTFEFNL